MGNKKSLFDFQDKSDIKSDNPEINKKYKNSKSEKAKRPTSDGTKGFPETTVTTIGENSNKLVMYNDPGIIDQSSIWVEPSTFIEDKFVDIPKDESDIIKYTFNGNSDVMSFAIGANTTSINISAFEPEKVDEIPICIVMGGKTYKIKDIEVDDWVKSIKDVIIKYQKMNMLILYLATSTYKSKMIDIEHYIKINNLESILVEV